MAISQANSFAAVLEKSELLGPEQLAQARTALDGIADSKAAAKKLIEKGLLTRWQASQLLGGKTDLHLGKYRLLSRLGSGGMGSVFLAEHKTMRRRVAIKTLPHDAAEKGAAAERLRAEARAIAALNHRNIIHAYDTELTGDHPYLVMEFVDGQDLQKIVEATGRLDFRRAADYIAQTAEGLAHAHSRGLTHRDIKPANLLVDPHGTVKILDLGLAALKNQNGQAEKPGENVLGTVDFLAPEQALGGQSLDHRADIYSLGCTLYFVLTAQPPFPEGSLAEKLVKHQIEEPRSILKLRPQTPHELVKICRRMMAKKADERFSSADEVAQSLRKWLSEVGDDVPDDANMPAPAASGAMPAVGPADSSPKGPPKVRPPVLAPAARNDGLDFLTESGPIRTALPRPRSAAAAEGETAPDRSKLYLLAGLGVGAVAVIGVMLFVLLRRPPASENAQVDPAPAPLVPVKTEKKPEPEKPRYLKNLPPLPGSDEDKKLKEAENKSADDAKTTDEHGDQPKPIEPPNNLKDPAKGGTPEKPVEPPQATPKATPKETPKESPPKPAEPAKEAPSNPLVQPVEPPKAAPSETPKETPKEAHPVRPAEPFKSFPAVVELPGLGAGELTAASELTTLGKIQLPADGALSLELALPGGKGGAKYLAAGANKYEWLIREEGKIAAEPVARLLLAGEELKFQWAAGAKPPADQIRNGLLTLKAGGKTWSGPLRKAKEEQPVTIDLEHPPALPRMVVSLDIEALPEGDNLWLQILKLDAADLLYEIKPVDLISIKNPPKPKEAPLIEIGSKEKKFGRPLGLIVTTTQHGRLGFKLDLVPQYEMNGVWLPFQPKVMGGRLANLQLEVQRMKDRVAFEDKSPRKNQQLIDNLNKEQIPAAEREIQAYEELAKLTASVQGHVKFNYRVFTKVDNQEIDLVRTQPPAKKK
ncbi:MAG TPA: protein kinase [Pirellulales bacterium]|jgi:serine/threonine protein kinase|nr:protein kinase [Pirellulales bacterium]